MAVLLLGRVVQGVGAGAEVVAVYVAIALVYPEARSAGRVRVDVRGLGGAFAGGAAGGRVGDPAVRVAVGVPRAGSAGGVGRAAVGARVPAVAAADRAERAPVRKGLVPPGSAPLSGSSAFTAGAQRLDWVACRWPSVGWCCSALSLRRLWPAGTLRAARGLPSVVLSRGLLAGAFASVEAYVPLTLTSVHGYSPAEAGLPLTVSRHRLGRRVGVAGAARRRVAVAAVAGGVRVRRRGASAGIAVIGSGVGARLAGATPRGSSAGAGMGLGVSSISVLLFDQSPEASGGSTPPPCSWPT